MIKAYDSLFEPEDHPTFGKRTVLPTIRKDLAYKIHFTSARIFQPDPETFRLIPYQEYLDWHTRVHDLGDVIWPINTFTDAMDAKEFIDEIHARNLYLFDIWGYVPGTYSNDNSIKEINYDPDLAAYIQQKLGSRFFGFDNGEQDGRYIGDYAHQMCPAGQNRKDQYDNFQHYFSFMHRHLKNDVAILCSLNFGHYLLKEQDAKLVGSECAQALLNVNLWYAYLRGAGKQYGRLWFGNVSVWNRWGWKEYDPVAMMKSLEKRPCGPDHGTSLSLLRRILYTQYIYNCDLLGFESGYLLTEKGPDHFPLLSPIGQIAQDGHFFVRQHGYPGALHTPVALYMDFHNGWAPPRHLYTSMIYRTWGNEPYTEGDYQMHALFSMIYPQYEEAGFYRDETGFLTATPFGDLFDVVFSDVSPEILSAYNQVVLLGDAVLTLEDYDKLHHFVEQGGSLVVFAGQIEQSRGWLTDFEPDFLNWFGLTAMGGKRRYDAHTAIHMNGKNTPEPLGFECFTAQIASQARLLAAVEGQPAASEVSRGLGKVTVILIPFGMNASAQDGNKYASALIHENRDNQPICQPFRLLSFVQSVLAEGFREQQIVRVDNPNLQYCVNLKAPDLLLVTIMNHTSCQQYYALSLADKVAYTVKEIEVPDFAHETVGYYAPAFQPGLAVQPQPGSRQVDPMQITQFDLASETSLYQAKTIERSNNVIDCYYLRLNPESGVQRQINDYPTLDSHFRGIRLDARYLLDRSTRLLQDEASSIRKRGLEVILDCSGLFNHYPDWSQVDVVMERYTRTLSEFTDCLDQVVFWGCNKVIIMLQRPVETGYTAEEHERSLLRTLFHMADSCRSRNMTLYLQNGTPQRLLARYGDLVEKIKEKQIRSIRFVLNISHALMNGENLQDLINRHAADISGLLVSSPSQDVYGQYTDRHAPVYLSAFQSEVVTWTQAIQKQCQLDFILMDSCYNNWNEIWADWRLLN